MATSIAFLILALLSLMLVTGILSRMINKALVPLFNRNNRPRRLNSPQIRVLSLPVEIQGNALRHWRAVWLSEARHHRIAFVQRCFSDVGLCDRDVCSTPNTGHRPTTL